MLASTTAAATTRNFIYFNIAGLRYRYAPRQRGTARDIPLHKCRSTLPAWTSGQWVILNVLCRLSDRGRRQHLDIGRDVEDNRPIQGQGFAEGRREVGRLLDPDSDRADILGDPGEIDLGVRPQLARLVGWIAAIDAVESALGLVAAAVVVDHGDGVDL